MRLLVQCSSQPAALTPRQRRIAEQKRQWQEQQQRQLKKGGASTATSTAPSAAPTAAAPLPQRIEVPAPRAALVNKQKTSLPAAPRASAPAATAAPAVPPLHTISATASSSAPSTSLAWSLWDSREQLDAHRQLARVATSTQLAQLARMWADAWAGSHPVSAAQAHAAQANIEALATEALARVRQVSGQNASSSSSSTSLAPAATAAAASTPQQELADLGWSLMHFPHPAAQEAARELEAAMHVPFRVLPHQMPQLSLAAFRAEVELRQDSITLRDSDGERVVPESRLTAWQSDIGATFKYSGKVMTGPRLTPNVAKVRDDLERLTGEHYDSCLINYYPDGRCGMRFHVDPLYDCWSPNSAVVSIGETRRFVFREISDFNSRWDYIVRNGDCVLMFGDCQDRLQHSIKVERQDRGAAELGPRMSLVFKQRLKDELGRYVQD